MAWLLYVYVYFCVSKIQLWTPSKKEENELLENSEKTIESRITEINDLVLELGHAPFRYTGPETLMHKDSQLKEIHQELKKSKDKQMVALFNLKQTESELTSKLCQRPTLVAVDKIPTQADLDRIRENIRRLNHLRDERWHEFRQGREEIDLHLRVLGEAPQTATETQLRQSSDDSYFALDPDNLIELKAYKERLERQKHDREQYKQRLEEQIAAVGRSVLIALLPSK